MLTIVSTISTIMSTMSTIMSTMSTIMSTIELLWFIRIIIRISIRWYCCRCCYCCFQDIFITIYNDYKIGKHLKVVFNCNDQPMLWVNFLNISNCLVLDMTIMSTMPIMMSSRPCRPIFSTMMLTKSCHVMSCRVVVSCCVSCVVCPVSCVACCVSCVVCRVSRVVCRVSCVACHVVLCVACHVSRVACRVSRVVSCRVYFHYNI